MAEEQRQSKNKSSGPAPAAKPQGRPGFGAPSAAHAGAEKYGPDFRHIVRVVNTDLKGEKKVRMALQKIKGLSHMFSNFVCHSAKVDPLKITGKLNQDEVSRLEDVIRNPAKYNCPSWMMNRRKDSETGNDIHIITTDLDLTIDNDIKKMKKIRSYKGVRHMLGQPVRGQRTKSNFRKNKGKVSLGVGGKKAAPKKA
ncbi:MAG TPA: 30S ribosomal protein S13 [Alphaproteobacteria bacterium]|nr:30S ribosomal protein S13 [Alphaproteobacteria bacterium]